MRALGTICHAHVVRGERGAHVDAEDGELHAEEGERHADRQHPEDAPTHDRHADGDEGDLERAAVDLAAAEDVAERLDVQVEPSKQQEGEEEEPWCRVMRARMPRAAAASSSVKEMVSIAMSGSLPTVFGLAWWRVCFVIHHE